MYNVEELIDAETLPHFIEKFKAKAQAWRDTEKMLKAEQGHES